MFRAVFSRWRDENSVLVEGDCDQKKSKKYSWEFDDILDHITTEVNLAKLLILLLFLPFDVVPSVNMENIISDTFQNEND